MDVKAAPEGDRRRWSAWRRSRLKGTTARSASSGSQHKLLSDKGSTVLFERLKGTTGACGAWIATHRRG
jgi:hypothetical protein